MRPLRFLEDHSRWNRLRALGQSGLVRTSVLMPAFGYMLLLNENVQRYLTIEFDGWLLDYLPATWRIWLLFYGSFLIAMASLLFAACCPGEIKRYESAFEMADAEAEHQHRLGQFEAERSELRKLYDNLGSWERRLAPQETPEQLDDFNVHKGIYHRLLLIYLVYHWQLRNIQSPTLRIFILISFSLGGALLAIPAIWTFSQVSWILLRRMFAP